MPTRHALVSSRHSSSLTVRARARSGRAYKSVDVGSRRAVGRSSHA